MPALAKVILLFTHVALCSLIGGVLGYCRFSIMTKSIVLLSYEAGNILFHNCVSVEKCLLILYIDGKIICPG